MRKVSDDFFIASPSCPGDGIRRPASVTHSPDQCGARQESERQSARRDDPEIREHTADAAQPVTAGQLVGER